VDWRKLLRWFVKSTPGADCYECERLNQEEAQAAIELAKMEEGAARARLVDARERLAVHRAVHHPLQCSAVGLG